MEELITEDYWKSITNEATVITLDDLHRMWNKIKEDSLNHKPVSYVISPREFKFFLEQGFINEQGQIIS